jgi:protein translocase SecG subunit
VVLQYVMTVLYVLVCLVLLMVILLQQGRGGDIAAAFGGSGSQTAFGARAGASLLTRVTTVTAVLFMIGAIGLGILWQQFVGRPREDRPGERAGDAGAGTGEEIGSGPDSSHAVRVRHPHLRKWRNWQTHQLEGLAPARA